MKSLNLIKVYNIFMFIKDDFLCYLCLFIICEEKERKKK